MRQGTGPVPVPRGSVERASQPVRVAGVRGPTRGVIAAAEDIKLTTLHFTIVAADIEGFGRYSRNNTNQVRIRYGMYGAMEHAFAAAGVPWSSCRREDRGDGVLILAPAEVPKALFVDRLPDALVEALVRHNRIHPAAEQIRLRLAIHAGEINCDEHGVTGSSLNHTFRLLDADVFRAALAESSAVLALIGSAWFFDEVIRHSERSHANSYRPADVVNKEAETRAWIRLVTAKPAARHRLTQRPYPGASGHRRLKRWR